MCHLTRLFFHCWFVNVFQNTRRLCGYFYNVHSNSGPPFLRQTNCSKRLASIFHPNVTHFYWKLCFWFITSNAMESDDLNRGKKMICSDISFKGRLNRSNENWEERPSNTGNKGRSWDHECFWNWILNSRATLLWSNYKQ